MKDHRPSAGSAAGCSRKEFLPIKGNGLAAGAMISLVSARSNAQTREPVRWRVPAKPDEPIILEKWKSEIDQQSSPTPTPLSPDQRVGYAVVGLGHLSLENILPSITACEKSKLVALVSGDPVKMKKVAAQYGVKAKNCYSYQTFDQIKNNKEVEAIYIVLPNGLHKEFVIRGAKAGKHILCEKPMANSSAECREMITACKQAGVKLMVAYRIQYQPHNRKLRELMQVKSFGDPKLIEASNCQSSANPEHWRHKKALAGGGALPDIGLYCLNTIRFISNEDPEEVFANLYSTPGNPLFKEVEELVSWQMKFPSGLIANCTTDYNVHESRYYRVLCEKGWYHMDKAFGYKGQLLKSAKAEGKLELQQDIGLSETDQFGVEMDHFSDCVIRDIKPYTPGEEGLQDHLLMEAIYRSAKEGRPVKINGLLPAGYRGPEPDLK